MDTEYRGAQFGFDSAVCNINGEDLTVHVGVTGGFIHGDSEQENVPANLAGGLDVDFDTYFIGGYASLITGKLAADALFRYAVYDADMTHGDQTIFNGTPAARWMQRSIPVP